jgi:hypothetical protein
MYELILYQHEGETSQCVYRAEWTQSSKGRVVELGRVSPPSILYSGVGLKASDLLMPSAHLPLRTVRFRSFRSLGLVLLLLLLYCSSLPSHVSAVINCSGGCCCESRSLCQWMWDAAPGGIGCNLAYTLSQVESMVLYWPNPKLRPDPRGGFILDLSLVNAGGGAVQLLDGLDKFAVLLDKYDIRHIDLRSVHSYENRNSNARARTGQ